MEMTKRAVKQALSIETDAELSRKFHPKISRWAVGQWPDDEPIPRGRQWELIARFPHIFEPGFAQEPDPDTDRIVPVESA